MNVIEEQGKVNARIVSFLKGNTNFTMATCMENTPSCANCFYAYDENSNRLIFKSMRETNHIKQALENRRVAGSVTPDRLEKTRIQGIQFRGIFLEPTEEMTDSLKRIYYNKYPFASALPGNIWAIELEYIKMTDNTLGFGKKIEWPAKDQIQKN